MLELTNSCNLDCIMCGNRKTVRWRGFMPIEIAIRVFNELLENRIKNVALHSTGEILLHPKLIDIVKEETLL